MKNSKDFKELYNGLKQGSVVITLENVLHLDSKLWTIAVPKTQYAFLYWHKKSHSDKAVRKNPRWFDAYNEKGYTFIIRNKFNYEAYQFHIETKKFYDYNNVEMDALEFFTEHKDAFNTIFDYLETFDRQKDFMDALV